MPKRIYVGNLPYSATEEEIRERFAEFGDVSSVRLITDRFSGQPRGFGFVEMEDEAADRAIAALNNTQLGGRNLKVSVARPRESGSERGGGGSGRW